jgi:N-acetylglucosamine-6-sulfatase
MNQPFFVWYTPYAPHAPQTRAARHVTITDTLPKGPAFNEVDVSDKPSFIRSKALLDSAKVANYQAQWRGRMTTLLAADEAVGMILDTLEAYGQTEKTYVIFLSDNGYVIGQHRIQPSKRWPYEEAIRLPLVIKGPGVPVGTNSDWLIMNDVMPTILQLTGLEIPAHLDGTSFEPLLRGEPLVAPRTAFLLENAFVGAEGIPVYKGIRTVINDTIWKYVYWTSTTRELYNLTTDPFELQSRHKTADSTRIASLHAKTLSLQACAAMGCWSAER